MTIEIFLRLSRIFRVISILGILTISGFGEDTLPSRPASGLYDGAGLFSPEEASVLAAELQAALENHHLEAYVATFQLVKGESMAERAARLRNVWARNPFAMVIVYDETLGQMSFVGSRDLEQFVDQQQLSGAFQRAASVARLYLSEMREKDEKPRPAAMIARTTKALLHDAVLNERMTLPAPWTFTKSMAGLLAIFMVTIAGAGLLVFKLESRLRQSKEASRRTDHFPITHMRLRLGGAYSGGKGVTLGE